MRAKAETGAFKVQRTAVAVFAILIVLPIGNRGSEQKIASPAWKRAPPRDAHDRGRTDLLEDARRRPVPVTAQPGGLSSFFALGSDLESLDASITSPLVLKQPT
jgi:hypothetical protein